ncbi:hypothetical protein RhiirC2_803516 [Rhizophagus irregularis]|uniref:Uncharacterized protein n=1 Tax=Rhizophagus irregularis TaxID=588596 RepID=A0A2N1LHC0_9GLOM|nr:hypothetical protein RhiirC2_803516 [Rhizophagus irregularis]
MSQPQIVIDPDDELRIVCRLLFYNIPGFHPNAKKLHKACQEKKYSFRLQDIAKWPLPYKAEDGRRVFVCSFLVIDVATRFKAGRLLISRNSLEI